MTTNETDYRPALIAALTRILGEWTAPGFLTGVAAREGVHLDPPAIVMVTVIAQKGPQRPSALAAHLVTGPSNISKIIRRLSEAGLVVRATDPEDARAQRVQLTPAGEHVAAAFVKAGDGMVDELLEGWSEADRRTFVTLLERFAVASTSFAGTLGTTEPPTTGEIS
ncbi:MarR family winged helix-turn-helix transcriptional regulator [Arthrobacter sp. 179]|uniref:MarR family winged helix-turn-helix transcriptional regulator n=1 Tax=Arthrobacter sp. 179 TaxID=3457734 RepID=UPI0026568F68|nr:MarR family winged helix-turn-helix transcriptional regulator [Micrococcaceae bacterium]